ncbi:MAG: co-chaperone DjlA [Pseudomonadales bacterium]|nr:co-chaperone DjlA [Pseudomonadales bacterium]
MGWLGKILGTGIGLALGGPLGAVLGAVLGHTAIDSRSGGLMDAIENKQTLYFVATFSMLAKLSKADGVVSREEINVIEKVMQDHLRLSPEARQFAIEIFNAAKDSDDSFESFAQQFYVEFGSTTAILTSVVELLLLVAHSDGQFHPGEEAMIRSAVRIFGLEDQYAQMLARFTGSVDNLNDCYQLLGASADESLASIKRKYRKLAMEYHPDRVQANGLSPEMAELAEAKFKDIQHAYDVIEKHHVDT